MPQKKKISNGVKKIIFLVLITLIVPIFAEDIVKAGASHNVYGWAWSENIGWISFNNLSLGAIPGGGGSVDYGVNIGADGKLSGYAWAGGGIEGSTQKPTIGWIRFNPESPYPTTPSYSACLDLPSSGQSCDGVGNYKFSGWARACSVFRSTCSITTSTFCDTNSNCPTGETCTTRCSGTLDPNRGSWDGWIKLRDTAGVWDGLWLDIGVSPPQFRNWAWGGNDGPDVDEAKKRAVIGWISFNCVEGGATGENICSTTPGSDYKVVTTFVINNPPQVQSPTKTGETCCVRLAPGIGYEYFGFTYFDSDSDPESRYQFQVDDNSDFSSSEVNRDFTGLSNPSPFTHNQTVLISVSPGADRITFGKTYYWRVRVYDNQGNNSGWQPAPVLTFNTPIHPLPSPNFELSPQSSIVNETVQFCSVQDGPCSVDKSICYDSANQVISCKNKTFIWTMPGTEGVDYRFVGGTTLNSANPKVKFLTPTSSGKVKLQITDDAGTCTTTDFIKVSIPLPKWKEIPPFTSWIRNYFANLISFFF